MAIEWSALDDHSPVPERFSIHEAKSLDDLANWRQIMTTVSEFQDFASDAWLEMYRDIGICDEQHRCLYLGEIYDRAVDS